MKLFCPVLAALLVAACSSGSTTPAPQESSSSTIPVTSQSPDAIARFQKGVDLLDNLRTTEAEKEFSAALALDAGFVQAHAYHGQAVQGPEGLQEIQSAAAAATSLPEAERVLIEGILANRVADLAKTREAAMRLTTLAPDDPRGHYLLGVQLLTDRKYAEAVQSLRRATELNPKAGGAQNMLGYAALRQGDTAGAIAAFNDTFALCRPSPIHRIRLARHCWRRGSLRRRKLPSGKRRSCPPSSGTPGTEWPTRSSTQEIRRLQTTP